MDKFSHTKRPQDTVPKEYNDIKDGLLYLLTVADENWKALETNPEGTSDFTVHTATIKWAVDVATKYTTI